VNGNGVVTPREKDGTVAKKKTTQKTTMSTRPSSELHLTIGGKLGNLGIGGIGAKKDLILQVYVFKLC